ncbi:DMT family transporter [Candidatus Woesearchaeota archaeon]|nr:DMT family transporter [Candidatus Woesearchaeota archaeon]
MSLSAGVLFGLILMIGWGTHKLFAKKLISRLGAYSGLIYTNSVIVSLIVIYCLVTGTFAVPSGNIFLLTLLLAVLGAFGVFFLYKSMEIGKLSIVIPVSGIYAVFVVILAFIFFGERLTSMQLAAVILAILGTLLISFKYSELKKIKLKKASKGVPYAFAATVCWGIVYFLIRIIVDELGPFVTSLYFETLVLVLLVLPAVLGFAKLAKPKKKDAKLILASGTLAGIGAVSYNAGVSMELVSIIGPLSGASLMVTVILSYLFLKERIDLNQKIAVLMIFAAILMLAL